MTAKVASAEEFLSAVAKLYSTVNQVAKDLAFPVPEYLSKEYASLRLFMALADFAHAVHMPEDVR